MILGPCLGILKKHTNLSYANIFFCFVFTKDIYLGCLHFIFLILLFFTTGQLKVLAHIGALDSRNVSLLLRAVLCHCGSSRMRFRTAYEKRESLRENAF